MSTSDDPSAGKIQERTYSICLAIDLARQYNLTLVGFAFPHRFNVYAGEQRVT